MVPEEGMLSASQHLLVLWLTEGSLSILKNLKLWFPSPHCPQSKSQQQFLLFFFFCASLPFLEKPHSRQKKIASCMAESPILQRRETLESEGLGSKRILRVPEKDVPFTALLSQGYLCILDVYKVLVAIRGDWFSRCVDLGSIYLLIWAFPRQCLYSIGASGFVCLLWNSMRLGSSPSALRKTNCRNSTLLFFFFH